MAVADRSSHSARSNTRVYLKWSKLSFFLFYRVRLNKSLKRSISNKTFIYLLIISHMINSALFKCFELRINLHSQVNDKHS